MRYRINWRFLLVCTLLAVAAGAGVRYAHRVQAGNQIGFFLHRADDARDAAAKAAKGGQGAEQALQLTREADYLRRYLLSRPGDDDSRERLVRLMCELGKTANELLGAHLALEEVLRRSPEKAALRRYAIDFAMGPRVRMFPEARAHIGILIGKKADADLTPADADLVALDARCLAADEKYPEAAKRYATAKYLRPDLADVYPALAAIQRAHQQNPGEADKTIAEMVAKNPTSAKACVNLAEYWRLVGRPAQPARVASAAVAKAQHEAFRPGRPRPDPDETTVAAAVEEAVGRALGYAPDDLAVILIAAETARYRALSGDRKDEARHLAEARALLTRGKALHETSSDVYLSLAALDTAEGRPADAVAVLQEGLKKVPDSVDLLAGLIDTQILNGDKAGAAETLGRLRPLGLSTALGDLQAARILVLGGQWVDAVRSLERVRDEFPDAPGRARQANLLLGRCYEETGNLLGRVKAFGQAIPLDSTDPYWVPAYRGLADAHAAAGNTAAALEAYRKLQERAPWAVVMVARLEVDRALRQPTAPHWTAAETAVAAAEASPFGTSSEVRLLRAELLYERGRPAEARLQLEALQLERPKEIEPWLALAALDQRRRPDQAAAILDAAEKAAGDSPDLRLARGRLWVVTAAPDLGPKLAGLAAGAKGFGPGGERRLLRGLAELATAAKVRDVAGRFWNQLAEQVPHDLVVHLHRFDRAAEVGDAKMVAEVLTDIKRVDGDNGVWVRLCDALVEISKAQKQNNPSGLQKALDLLDGVNRDQPGWGRVALAQALAYDLQARAAGPHAASSDPQKAAAAAERARERYQEAIRLGEYNPPAVRRLVELLADGRRWPDAGNLLRRFPEVIVPDPAFQRVVAVVRIQTGSAKEALEAARQAAPEASKDPRDHAWRGQMFWEARKLARPEKAADWPAEFDPEAPFRRAVELDPEGTAWRLNLIQYLAAAKQPEAALKELELAEPRVKTDRSQFLARGYDLLGRFDKAGEWYRKAREEKPQDAQAAADEATFLFRTGRRAEAEEAYRRVAGLPGASAQDKAVATRMRALCLAADSDPQTARRAIEVLDQLKGIAPQPPQGGSVFDKRARAYVLSLQHDRESRLEAIQLLVDIRDTQEPTDKYLLAQLYRTVGDLNNFRVVMTDLVRTAPDDPVYSAYFAEWLLRKRDPEPDAAAPLVEQVHKLLPDALLVTALQARVLVARNDRTRARSLLLERAAAPGAPVGQIGQVCEDLGLHAEAEQLLKQFADQNKATAPQAVLGLAAFYGRQGRISDALAACDEARAKVPVTLVGNTAVVALYDAPARTPADVARVAVWLDEAAGNAPPADRAVLLQQIASVRNLQRDFALAADLYRRAVEANDRDVLAMNNLAFLLSLDQNKHDDALGWIDRALGKTGQNPDLLDTKALILLKRGDATRGDVEAACKLLKQVTAEAPGAAAFFHLTQAELAAGRKVEAQRAWRRAVQLGLKPSDLHTLEQTAYENLCRSMQ